MGKNIRSRNPILAALLALSPLVGHSAPGTLADSPLFLGTATDPNILFLIDDSGSMDWEVMSRDYARGGRFTGTQPDGSSPAGSGSVTHRDGDNDGTVDCGFGDGFAEGYMYGVEFGSNSYTDDGDDCNTADDEAWRFRNSDYNPLYFDPTKTYRPWAGVDNAGTPFTDIDILNAPNNPYNPTELINLTQHNSNWGGGTIRLTSDRDGDAVADGFRYYTWTDADGDGLFDDGEQTEVLIKDAGAATQQNFANWFSYYRSRELVAKAAYGRVIAEGENVRMGLVTLHNNNGVNTQIRAMNSDPASGNKRALLDELYSFNSANDTPLRSRLYDCGRYLECASTGLFSHCPALSQADGGNCQQNFVVVMTDGFYNGGLTLANKDGDNNTDWDSNTNGPFGDSRSNTLGDVAMYFYERDLHTGLTDDVPKKAGVDEAQHQHVVTYTVAFGVDGTLTAMPANDTDPFAWPNPADGDAEKIDDLRHAAYNGRGLYLSAQDPDALMQSLTDAITDIAKRTGSAGAVTFNTSRLEANSTLYLALFNSTKWSGQLLAYPLNGLNGEIASSADWDAADVLDARNLGPHPRTMLTYNGTQGIPFQWANLTAAQRDDLKTNPGGGVDNDTLGQARLDFLRGDRGHEGSGNNYRIRGGRLGDIVHASPVYVGKPELRWPDHAPFPTGTAAYSEYKTAKAARAGVVYVGANDGMLHGFTASDGSEALAYAPSNLFSTTTTAGLHYLADPDYSHRYFVDLSPTISDVYIATRASATPSWATVLIGGQAAGGRALYALDITDPTVFAEGSASNIVLWEFTEADLGYTFSRPSVVLLNNGRWAAVFGNGYNDSGSGTAQLFIVFLDAGLDGSWTAGTDYLQIDTGVGSAGDRNGLASPAVIDTDGNGTADRVYVGDLRGNLWVFDLCNEHSGTCQATGWDVAYKQGSTPKPLFTAAGNQPITNAPVVTYHPTIETSSSNEPNVLVMFGTGQFLVSGDRTSTDPQSFYIVWDEGTDELVRSNLLEQTVTTVSDVRVVSNDAVAYTAGGGSKKYGCFIDLPESGERIVTRSAIRGDLVYFNSMVPSSAACTSGGHGWLMSLVYANCGRPDAPTFDRNGDGEIDCEHDCVGEPPEPPVGKRFDHGLPGDPTFLSNKQYTPGTDTDEIEVREVEELDEPNTGRLSWEQVN